ncbi:MAG: BPSS1780 family membrane protein [Rhodanobacteraceae bacterium]
MSMHKVPAEKGIKWLASGVSLILSKPAVFLVMGLILAAINLVPVLGGLALAILGPALLGGIAFAAREHSLGRSTDVGQLFRAFQQPGKIGPMLLLCLPGVVGGFALLILFFVFAASALLGGGFAALENGSAANMLGTFGGGALILLLISLAIVLVMYALQFFAIPRVMLDNIEPFAAMRESLGACRTNAGAFLLLCVVLLIVFVVLAVILMFIPLLGWLALMTAGWAVTGCAMYVAYVDVFAPEPTAQPLPPAAEPPTT